MVETTAAGFRATLLRVAWLSILLGFIMEGILLLLAAGFGIFSGLEPVGLGVVIGWIGRRPWGGALAHVAVGLVVGVLFGGVIVALTYSTAPASPAIVSQSVNEVLRLWAVE